MELGVDLRHDPHPASVLRVQEPADGNPAADRHVRHHRHRQRPRAAGIPHATLVEFLGLGHAPKTQEPAQFHTALLQGLSAL